MYRSVIGILLLLFIVLFASFAYSDEKLSVFVTITPQKYVVDKISGGSVETFVVVPDGANPHTFEPKASQLVEMSKSKLYLSIGGSFDDVWLKKLIDVNQKIKVVRVDSGIKKIQMNKHEHGQGKDDGGKVRRHDKKLYDDPHIWLSIENMEIIAKNSLEGLIKVDPSKKSIFEGNYSKFSSELNSLRKKMIEIFTKDKIDKKFIVFHPAWGYFAKEFGLKQVAVEVEGKEPSPKQLKEVIKTAMDNNIKVVFVQPQISSTSADVIAKEIGGEVVKLNPLEYNWMNNMESVANAFSKVVK